MKERYGAKGVTDAIREFWRCIEAACHSADDLIKYHGVRLNTERQNEFRFETHYSELYQKTQRQMQNPAQPLDRHKTAAIVVLSAVAVRVLDTSALPNNSLLENVALQAGLNVQLSRLNWKLQQIGKKPVDRLIDPMMFYHAGSYIDHLARLMHNRPPDVFELADRLYLLEYITLLQNRIDVALLVS
ncbi:MAG: hypothetical protein LBG83_03025 [Oscillospiraceae bacterium]|nr:hypothetical protein [Oscillospiraceae bacterium]